MFVENEVQVVIGIVLDLHININRVQDDIDLHQIKNNVQVPQQPKMERVKNVNKQMNNQCNSFITDFKETRKKHAEFSFLFRFSSMFVDVHLTEKKQNICKHSIVVPHL